MSDLLWRWSASDLAKAIRDKSISSRAAVEAHLARIEAVNPAVNAVTVVLADQALAAADQADEALATGRVVGPLHGVPITVKENLDLVGSATTHGIVALKESMPTRDAPVIAHLKRAGAIPIGRTNQPDFGLRWHTDNDLRGATRNPWDPRLTPGGSSGGEAAALACGMSPLGIGGDMGGSLRYPAQCCAIAALKPGLGRISRTLTTLFDDPPMLYEQVASTIGPMARHVKDLRLALDVMSQPDPDDPCWTPAPRLGTEVPRPITVALTFQDAEASVAEGLRRAARFLSDAGYRVEEADPPMLGEASQALEQIANTETEPYLADMLPMMSRAGARVLEQIVADTKPGLAAYRAAIAERYRIAQAWARFMAKRPLILGPVSALPPQAVDFDLAGRAALLRFIGALVLTEACNLLGLPSVAVPVRAGEGLPQGVQIIAPRFHEDLCLDAAEAMEQRQEAATPIDPRTDLA
ncbi:MAG: amidase [Pseudomonadota bacterium]